MDFYNQNNRVGGYVQPTYTQSYPQQPVTQTQYVQQPPAESGILWVQGEAGAKSYAVAPGRSVMLMDSEQERFYIKTADASGMPMPLRIFEYKEVTQQTDIPIQTQPEANYVTRDEFEALAERLDALTKRSAAKKEK